MDSIKVILERDEKGKQDPVIWSERFNRAVSARMQWDEDTAKVDAILSNKVGIIDDKNAITQFSDKMFHTNWLLKLCIFLESYISSADITFDLKAQNAADNQYNDRFLLENELNQVMSYFEMPRTWCQEVIPNRVRRGFGVSYGGWNGLARDRYWRNGKPNFVALDPRRVWVDESAGGVNFKDRMWVFAKFEVPTDEAKEMFPDFEKDIADTMAKSAEGDPANKKNKFDYYLIQYNKTKRIRVIDVQVTVDGIPEIQQIPYEQFQEWVANNPTTNLPDNLTPIEERDDKGELGYITEIKCAFQFLYSHELSKVLTEPEWVGERDQFQFWCYHRINDDIYPRGIGYMLKDEQTLKTINLTKTAFDVIMNGQKTPVAREGAIKNWTDFVKNHGMPGFVAVLSEEWALMHPQEKAIDWIEMVSDPAAAMFLNNLLQNEMQQLTGGTDSMMGQAQFSGMSAAQTGLLQSSGATYTKNDELSYRDYCGDIAQCYLWQIAQYMTYEHTLEGIDQSGKSTTLIANKGNRSNWDSERYMPIPIIENNPEMIKQLKKDEAKQLVGMGAMHPVDMLRELGYANAEQILARADERNGLLQMIQKLQANPNLQKQIMEAPEDTTKTASNASQK